MIVIVACVSVAAIVIVSWFLLRSGGTTKGVASTSDKSTQTLTVLVSHVVSKDVDRQLKLPGELRAYQDVAIYPKVQGFVETINVDRGSVVKRGQVLIRMSAPELSSRTAEAQARVGGAKDQRLEMEARVRSVREQNPKSFRYVAIVNRSRVIVGNAKPLARGESGRQIQMSVHVIHQQMSRAGRHRDSVNDGGRSTGSC